MHSSRRRFLGGLLAAGAVPVPTWADAGAPAFVSAAGRPDGSFVLCGIARTLDIVFEIPLPARGHAAAAHPTRPEAVAFARRPGTFAVVINCVTGAAKARLEAPDGRHFYGHGAFSQGGDILYTTENDYEAGRGRIGIWDVAGGYRRIGEFDSGGIGPHEIKRLPHSDTLVVANGGIDTHPDSGRAKLNIPTMQSNLSYLEGGRVVETAGLPRALQKNSIRHLAVAQDGTVAFGMQWQGEGAVGALVGQHRRTEALALIATTPEQARALDGYIGSVAFTADGARIAATSPRGNLLHLYGAAQGVLEAAVDIEDVCGAAPLEEGFVVTSGTGGIARIAGAQNQQSRFAKYAWDNHLVAI
ncbi:MAG: DUF1513 domain-containing protein [Sulfitobacter sp.]